MIDKYDSIVDLVFEQPDKIFGIGLLSNWFFWSTISIMNIFGFISTSESIIILMLFFIIGLWFFHIAGKEKGFDNKFDMFLILSILTILGIGLIVVSLVWVFILKPIVDKIKNMDVPQMYQTDD